MQISTVGNPFSQSQAAAGLTTQARSASFGIYSSGSPATGELSTLAQLTYSHEISDFTYSQNETSFMYRAQDNSLAARVQSSLDVRAQREHITLDLTFSAEFLGLTAKDFADGGMQPIRVKVTFEQSQLDISSQVSVNARKTIRKPDDILQDLGSALREVFKDRGNKSVAVILDDEAVQSLFSDKKIAELFAQLIMLLQVVNALKMDDGPTNLYKIFLSGKGKPVIEVDEKTLVEARSVTVEINLTILPPGESVNPEAAAAPEAQPPALVDSEA